MPLTKAGEANLQQLTLSNNLFTRDIYKEAIKGTVKNLVISPFSLQTILALTQSGAKDETASEIRASLHLPNTSKETADLYSQLLPTVKGMKQCVLKTANKIYVENAYPLDDNFKKLTTEVYLSEIENINFTQATDAAGTINTWVEHQTNHKIKNLVDPKGINKDTRVILVNALYFKGKWIFPFDEIDTEKRAFYKTPQDQIQVDTMMNSTYYNYCEDAKLNAKFLEIVYKGNKVSTVFVLPNEKDALPTIENQLDKILTVSNFTNRLVSVLLPKFRIEDKFEMKAMLENLGIQRVFTSEADLSGIGGNKGDLVISDVVQKVFIDVNEAGTEAAAATAVEGAGGGGPGVEDVKEFIADHPFLFIVKLRASNVVLFVGRFNGS